MKFNVIRNVCFAVYYPKKYPQRTDISHKAFTMGKPWHVRAWKWYFSSTSYITSCLCYLFPIIRYQQLGTSYHQVVCWFPILLLLWLSITFGTMYIRITSGHTHLLKSNWYENEGCVRSISFESPHQGTFAAC